MAIDLELLPQLMEPIARELLGEPNRGMSSKTEWRYGSNGSLSIDLAKGTFYDHEAQQGGGVLALIERETRERGDEWIEQHFPEVIQARPKPRPKINGGKHASPLGKEVAWYDYVDEAGTLLFQVVRFEPKTFRQRHREGERWVWGARGIRQVPYHLPELIEATAEGHIILICEGEKDVDNLKKLGIPATCNAGGVGKWSDGLTDFFREADVVVIQDNDPQARNKDGVLLFHDDGRPRFPGQDHAREVCTQLSAVAQRVRLLDLASAWPDCPKKGDISDWIVATKGTAEQLYEIIDRAPVWSPDLPGPQTEVNLPKLAIIDLAAWDGQPVPDRRWEVRNLIPARNVTLLSGDGGVGKTLLTQQLAVATVLGRDWIGELPNPGPVLLISAEDDDDEIHFRLDKIVKFYDAGFRDLKDLHILSLAGKDAALAVVGNHSIVKPTALWESVRMVARDLRPRWIGIDTAADVFIVEERDRSQVRQCLSLLRGLAMEIDAAIVLLSHPSLVGMASGSGLSGSTAWNNSVRSRLYLRNPRKNEVGGGDDDEEVEQSDVRILETMKANYAEKGSLVRLQWRNGLLLPERVAAPAPGEPPVPSLSSAYGKVYVEQKIERLIKKVVAEYDQQDRLIAENQKSNNNIAAAVWDTQEAKTLAKAFVSKRKFNERVLLIARQMLSAEQITTGKRPRRLVASKQTLGIVPVVADIEPVPPMKQQNLL